MGLWGYGAMGLGGARGAMGGVSPPHPKNWIFG